MSEYSEDPSQATKKKALQSYQSLNTQDGVAGEYEDRGKTILETHTQK